MKTKRLSAFLLALIMCFTLASCLDDTADNNSSETASTEQSTESVEQSTESTDQSAESTDQSTESADQSTESADQSTESTDQSTESGDGSENTAPKPLLYRVTDKKGNTAWLFGSIHTGREDFYPLPDYVTNAFNGADSLAVEFNIIAFENDLSLQIKAMTELVYKDGSTIKDHIPKDLYDKAVAILKGKNSYAAALDMYCPAFWSSMIESLMLADSDYDVSSGIDRYLIEKASEAEKEILDIESAEFQYRMMAGFEDDIQRLMLESAVLSYALPYVAFADLETLMDLWASGDESAFAEYLTVDDDTMTAEEKQIYARYNKAMMTDRNIGMADFAENALTSGKEVFICVGAAHIVGDGSVSDLLSERGYTVELITK